MEWRKSSHSYASGNCVQAARWGPVVLVRDSRNPDWPVLAVTTGEWRRFLTAAKAGRYDLP